MPARHDKAGAKMRQAARYAALARPELTRGDRASRVFPAGPTAAAVKADDPATRQLIDEALAKRAAEAPA